MASIERILVPTDFSPSSYAALGYAVSLGARLGAAIEVLGVYDAVEGVAPDAQVVVAGGATRPLVQVLRERAEADMERFVSDVPGRTSVSMRTRIASGKPADVICQIADQDRFDLIVMGTHGRTGIARVVVGSVAEKVVRDAACPVLTVRVRDSK